MTVVRLYPKSTLNVAGDNTPSDFAGALADGSTTDPNGSGTFPGIHASDNYHGDFNYFSLTYGEIQNLTDVGQSGKPILGWRFAGKSTDPTWDSANSRYTNAVWVAPFDKRYLGEYFPGYPPIYPVSSDANYGYPGSYDGDYQASTTVGTAWFSKNWTTSYIGDNGRIVPITEDVLNNFCWVAVGAGPNNIGTGTQYFFYLEVLLADSPGDAGTLYPDDGTTVTTSRPTVGLEIYKPISGQRIKAQWQFATDSGFTQDVILFTQSDTQYKTANSAAVDVLPASQRLTKEGTWYFRGRTIDEFGQTGPWTSPNTLIVDLNPPPTPTGITPNTGTTVNTDIPTLGGTCTAASDGQNVKMQWQLSTGSAFTVNVRLVEEPDSAFRTSGASTYAIPSSLQLYQTTWYVRGREIDQFGQTSDWTSYKSFTVSHPPSPNNMSPTGGGAAAYDVTVRLSWMFGDTSPVDNQTAYQLIVEKNSDGTQLYDSGKVTSSDKFADVPTELSWKDIQLRWKLKLWDSDDISGSYSNYSLFTISDGPTVSITSPENNSDVNTGKPTVTWSFTGSGGRTQSKYQVIYTKVGDGSPTLDTGVISGSATTYTPSTLVMHNNDNFNIRVRVWDTLNLPGTTAINVTAQYTTPDAPYFQADETYYEDYGYIRVTWSVAADPSFLYWRVYRRPQGATDWEVAGDITQSDVTEFHDWQVPAEQYYEYTVVQAVDRFGENVESTISMIQTVYTASGGYWLVDPNDSSNNVRLSNVKDDQYTLVRESASYTVIGRGRHTDYGETLGYDGTLTAQLRDDRVSTARAKKIALETLLRKKIPVYLRNPFGDVTYISLGDIQTTRIPGVGVSEFVDISVPYSEVVF